MATKLRTAMEEEATGIRQSGALRIFSHGHDAPISADEAKQRLEKGDPIHVPSAGAGSYRQVAETLGLEIDCVWDDTSSAGDWVIKLKDGRGLSQTNRYPRFGFIYALIESPNWEEEG